LVGIAQNGPSVPEAEFLPLSQNFEPECRFVRAADFADRTAPLIVKEGFAIREEELEIPDPR
jgi:hypothetical protein